jgi:hypothetical protein
MTTGNICVLSSLSAIFSIGVNNLLPVERMVLQLATASALPCVENRLLMSATKQTASHAPRTICPPLFQKLVEDEHHEDQLRDVASGYQKSG